MMYTAIGTPKQLTGTTEGTLLGSNPDVDFVGYKQYQDPEKGYLGGGLVVTQGISSTDAAANTYRVYIGFVKVWEYSIIQEADQIVVLKWALTVKDISSDTLTLAVDLQVWRGEYSNVIPCSDVNVDRAFADESNFLDAIDVTLESSAAGKGAQVRQILIN